MEETILKGNAARKKLLEGAEKLSKAVKLTLGPKGRTVALEKPDGNPLVTKDGVSVALEIDLPDPFENMGSLLVREASRAASDETGDGTTTYTVLTAALFKEGLRLIEAGVPPTPLKRGMDKAAAVVESLLVELSKPVSSLEQIRQVATLSANGDEKLGEVLSQAIDDVGKDGVIHIEEGRGLGLEKEIQEGYAWDKGPVVTDFLIKEGTSIELENAYVLVTDLKVSNLLPLVPLLEEVSNQGMPLVMVAPEFDPTAVTTLFKNFVSGTLISLPVLAPSFGEKQQGYLKDIAILTGTSLISKEVGQTLEGLTLESLGFCEKVISTRNKTTILGGKKDDKVLIAAIETLRGEISRAGSEYDREKLEDRLSKLTGGICTIKVGGATELEIRELKARLEDALSATRSSMLEGVVPGGGAALYHAGIAARALDDYEDLAPLGAEEAAGFEMVLKGTEIPMWQILTNAGLKADALMDRIAVMPSGVEHEDEEMGVDARTGDLCNMFECGIIDPLKVVRVGFTQAVSLASMLLTTEVVIHKNGKNRADYQG